jgi:hypothetical protein
LNITSIFKDKTVYFKTSFVEKFTISHLKNKNFTSEANIKTKLNAQGKNTQKMGEGDRYQHIQP